MTAARTCGATFTPTSAPVANVIPRERLPGPRPRPGRTVADANPRPATTTAAPPPVTAPVPPPAPAPAPEASQPIATGPTAAPISAEDHAKNEIQQLVNSYCAALETRNPKEVRKLFPLAPMDDLRTEFSTWKSLRCTISSPPAYDRLDASAAGGAQLKFGMKQELRGNSGGAPDVKELIITMVVSRKNFQSRWLIDRIQADPKPKN